MIERLFIFAIGGTGSRVLKSLIMLMAAGSPINAREIIPIIIDPDNHNGNLDDTTRLLKKYQIINKHAVPDAAVEGFFRPKIRTLADLDKTGLLTNNSFSYDFGSDTNDSFRTFIDYYSLDGIDKKFIDTLFSKNNLDSNLSIGFKGNPNVGSIVLNSFEKSTEFNLFTTVFNNAQDKIFIISSIFGGTGASGFPLLVKLLRNNTKTKDAQIGAISIGPYFIIGNVTDNGETEKIDSSVFITKTKAAYSYYEKNLKQVDALYYLSDTMKTDLYDPSTGGLEQYNKAHLIELIGATAISKFCQLPNNVLRPPGWTLANIVTKAFEYGLKDDVNALSFVHLGTQTAENLLGKPLLLFKYLSHLVNDHIENESTGLAWARNIDFNNSYITSSDCYKALKDVLIVFELWLDELSQNRRTFKPFVKTKNLSQLLAHKTIKGRFHTLSATNFDDKFNSTYKQVSSLPNTNEKLLTLLWKGINGVFDEWVKKIT